MPEWPDPRIRWRDIAGHLRSFAGDAVYAAWDRAYHWTVGRWNRGD